MGCGEHVLGWGLLSSPRVSERMKHSAKMREEGPGKLCISCDVEKGVGVISFSASPGLNPGHPSASSLNTSWNEILPVCHPQAPCHSVSFSDALMSVLRS